MSVRLAGIALLLLVACRSSSPKGSGVVVTSSTDIELLEPVRFTSETELTPGSYKSLDAIASTFVGNPSLQLVEVQVYVLDGDEATRQQRADQRARLIVDYLVSKQVAAGRLAPQGYITPPAEEPTNHVRFVVLKRGQDD